MSPPRLRVARSPTAPPTPRRHAPRTPLRRKSRLAICSSCSRIAYPPVPDRRAAWASGRVHCRSKGQPRQARSHSAPVRRRATSQPPASASAPAASQRPAARNASRRGAPGSAGAGAECGGSLLFSLTPALSHGEREDVSLLFGRGERNSSALRIRGPHNNQLPRHPASTPENPTTPSLSLWERAGVRERRGRLPPRQKPSSPSPPFFVKTRTSREPGSSTKMRP